jgi:hypothetical protein
MLNWKVEMLISNLRYRATLSRILRNLTNQRSPWEIREDDEKMRREYSWYCRCCQKCGRKPRP